MSMLSSPKPLSPCDGAYYSSLLMRTQCRAFAPLRVGKMAGAGGSFCGAAISSLPTASPLPFVRASDIEALPPLYVHLRCATMPIFSPESLAMLRDRLSAVHPRACTQIPGQGGTGPRTVIGDESATQRRLCAHVYLIVRTEVSFCPAPCPQPSARSMEDVKGLTDLGLSRAEMKAAISQMPRRTKSGTFVCTVTV